MRKKKGIAAFLRECKKLEPVWKIAAIHPAWLVISEFIATAILLRTSLHLMGDTHHWFMDSFILIVMVSYIIMSMLVGYLATR